LLSVPAIMERQAASSWLSKLMMKPRPSKLCSINLSEAGDSRKRKKKFWRQTTHRKTKPGAGLLGGRWSWVTPCKEELSWAKLADLKVFFFPVLLLRVLLVF
jgi:hypothetical protein